MKRIFSRPAFGRSRHRNVGEVEMSSEEEAKSLIEKINEGKANFSDDEQNIIESWLSKLSGIDDSDESQAALRNDYLRNLEKLINRGNLSPPFNNVPPEDDLVPLQEPQSARTSFQIKKMPCPKAKMNQDTGAIPKCKSKKVERSQRFQSSRNEYEDPEEMAKAIARSKGQLFPEFVASIARHTSDYGQTLNESMKYEVCKFRDYVNNVLSQRIKDLTQVLDEEQNRELVRIKKDTERWKMELNNVKKRIREIIPDFDIEDYKQYPNYLAEIFAVDATPIDDELEKWKEETTHRIRWVNEMTRKTAKCNEEKNQQIANIYRETSEIESSETAKQQNHLKFINREIAEYRKLKSERDRLQKEYLDLLSKFQEDNKCK